MCVIAAGEPGVGVRWVHELIRLYPRVSLGQVEAGHVEITVILAVTSESSTASVYLFHRGKVWDVRSVTNELLRPPAKWLCDTFEHWPGRRIWQEDVEQDVLRIQVGRDRIRAHPYTINFGDSDVASVWPQPNSPEQAKIASRYKGDVPYTVIRMSGFEADKNFALALTFRAAAQPLRTGPDEVIYPVMGPFRFREQARSLILSTENGHAGAASGEESPVSQRFQPALWREEHPVTDVAIAGMPRGMTYSLVGGSEHLSHVLPIAWVNGAGPVCDDAVGTAYAFSPSDLDFGFWVAARAKETNGGGPPIARWIEEAQTTLEDSNAAKVLGACAKHGPLTREAVFEQVGKEAADETIELLKRSAFIFETARGYALTLVGEQAMRLLEPARD